MPLDITTRNLDSVDPNRPSGYVNPGLEKNLTRLKFEEVIYSSTPEPKKAGFFKRFISGLSKFAPLAMIAGGPIGLIAGAGLMSAGAVADNSIQRKNLRDQQAAAQQGPQVLSFPGMGPTLASDPTLATIANTRDNAATAATASMQRI